MGKKHMASKNPHARKRPKFNFRNLPPGANSPTLVVADYLFGDEHSESSVLWLMRKLDRYKNDSSFTSEVCSLRIEGDETPTSLVRTNFSNITEVVQVKNVLISLMLTISFAIVKVLAFGEMAKWMMHVQPKQDRLSKLE